MSVGAILLVILFLALLGALPAWPYSREWGYAPGGTLGLLLLIILIILFLLFFLLVKLFFSFLLVVKSKFVTWFDIQRRIISIYS